MRPGELDQFCKLYKPQDGRGQDDYGQHNDDMTLVGDVWARIRYVIGDTHMSMLYEGERGTAKFVIHQVSGIKPGWMIDHQMPDGPVRYEILDVLPVKTGDFFLELIGRSTEIRSQ